MRLTERLRRVERQLRALGDLHVRDLGELAGRTGAEDGDEIARKLVVMGTNAVPTLIAMAQKAANTDPLVLGKSQDYEFERSS